MGRIWTRPRTPLGAQLLRPERKPQGGLRPPEGWHSWLLGPNLATVQGEYPLTQSGTGSLYWAPDGEIWQPGAITAYLGNSSFSGPVEALILDFEMSVTGLLSSESTITVADFNTSGNQVLQAGSATSYLTNETISLTNNDVASNRKTGITDSIALGRHALAFIWNGSNYDIYLDGRRGNMIVAAAGHAGQWSADRLHIYGRRYSADSRFDLLSAQICTKRIDTALGESLSRYPYKLFRAANDRSFVYVSAAPGVTVERADETDSADTLAPIKTQYISMGQAAETGSGLGATPVKDILVSLGLTQETDSALDISLPGAANVALGMSTEADSALTISPPTPINIVLGLASEVDAALAITLLGADHLRKQLRDAVVTALTGLTTTGSNVFESRALPLGAKVPALCIYTNEEIFEYDLGETGCTPRRLVTLTIEGYHKGDDDDTLDDIAKEVETAIFSDPTFSGLAEGLTGVSTTLAREADGDQETGVITLTFGLAYRARDGAPTVAVN